MSITMGQLAQKLTEQAGDLGEQASTVMGVLAQVGVGQVKKSIKAYKAIDTGTMLNSTTADGSGTGPYLIGPTTNYAAFVALGTSRMAARPFHLTAAELLQAQVESYMDKLVKKVMQL